MPQWKFKSFVDVGMKIGTTLLSSASVSPMQARPAAVGRQFSSRIGGTSSSASKGQVLDLPIYSFTTINPLRRLYHVRERDAEFEVWESQSLRGATTVVGFDIEWRPNFVKDRPQGKVAVIQVATEYDVSVVQISNLGEVPQHLQDILQNPKIMKVGVGIDGDARKLLQDWQVKVTNILDLSFVARGIDPYWEEQDAAKRLLREQQQREEQLKRVEEKAIAMQNQDPGASTSSFSTSQLSLESSHPTTTTSNKVDENDDEDGEKPDENKQKGGGWKKRGLISLKRLTIRYLSMQLQKSKKVQTSNWEKPLTERMLEYAANDAYVAYDIYQRLLGIQDGSAPLPTQEVP